MKAEKIDIQWREDLSIYASEKYLKLVGDEYGWLGGHDGAGALRCILPYTIVRKPLIRMVRFRVETMPVGPGLSVEEEKEFLNSAVEYFRSIGADMIIPATTNTIFRTYPDGADAAPYGSYVIDLTQPEEKLWANLHSKHRNVVRNATKKGVEIRCGREHLKTAHELVRDTLKRSHLGFIGYDELARLADGLGEHMKVFIATHDGAVQGCAICPYSAYGAYYLYGGSIQHPQTGATNLIHWEAIRTFRNLGVRSYDFVGVRINPKEGTKQEGLMLYKKKFGGQLLKGYIWKCSIKPMQYFVYNMAVRYLRGGDIVDQERHKLEEAGASSHE